MVQALLADRDFRSDRKRETRRDRIRKDGPDRKEGREPKEETEKANVESIHPSEKERGGKKRSLLDTCK